MEKKDYHAEFDLWAKLITNFVLAGSLVLLAVSAFEADRSSSISYLGSYLLLPLIFITWGLHPQYYTINTSTIIIRRFFRNIVIPINEVTGIRQISPDEVGFHFRVFASGGLFGYFGTYTSRNLGVHKMWCRNKSAMVLIIYRGQKIIISPGDPAAFVMAVQSRQAAW